MKFDDDLRFRDTLKTMKSEHGDIEFTYHRYENDEKDAIHITRDGKEVEILVDEWDDFLEAVSWVKDRLTVYTGYPVGPSPNHPATR